MVLVAAVEEGEEEEAVAVAVEEDLTLLSCRYNC